MPLISEPDLEKLRQKFRGELEGSVTVRLARHAAGGSCRSCTLADALLSEITSLSDRLSLERAAEHEAEHLPAITLRGREQGQVVFHGLPSGFELPAFIDSIIDVSRGRTELDPRVRDRLAKLERDVRIEVFTTPT